MTEREQFDRTTLINTIHGRVIIDDALEPADTSELAELETHTLRVLDRLTLSATGFIRVRHPAYRDRCCSTPGRRIEYYEGSLERTLSICPECGNERDTPVAA